jgi:hypothetical protein
MKEYPNDRRFQQTLQGEAVESEYDFDSDDVNDAYMRNVLPFSVINLDLSVARTNQEFIIPGRAIQYFDYTTSDASKAPVGTSLITISLNDNNDDKFPMRYKRGYNGTFSRLYISNTAQAGLSADLVLLRSKRIPYMNG